MKRLQEELAHAKAHISRLELALATLPSTAAHSDDGAMPVEAFQLRLESRRSLARAASSASAHVDEDAEVAAILRKASTAPCDAHGPDSEGCVAGSGPPAALLLPPQSAASTAA